MLSLPKHLYRFVWGFFNEAVEMLRQAQHDRNDVFINSQTRSKKDSLLATLQYKSFENKKRKDWSEEVYTLNRDSVFILTKYEYNSKRYNKNAKSENLFRRYVLKEYYLDASLKRIEREGLLRSHSYEYYADGKPKDKSHRRLFGSVQRRYYSNSQLELLRKVRYLPGIVNRMTISRYSEDGELISSRKRQFRTPHYR
ncbi:hypothetical protein LRS06_17835 [Hymenobacter sp. J193]|uniref:hypothetical protein n=1 Tax=Hymenobacter sp. J193 TaxID=2898429 RepID=UPI00215172A2|nr:hypothetical protein [Hymenobacter sp. J193]MCR5889599.1 hypothetical protein [Hymenobacter sp. J193]